VDSSVKDAVEKRGSTQKKKKISRTQIAQIPQIPQIFDLPTPKNP
jgi:hypothetical protein